MKNWITDAQFAEGIDEQSVLVSNHRIEKFLARGAYNQFIIVASKGMGKTLLLRHKRKLIEKENPSILLIPRDGTSDYVSLPTSLEKEIVSLMNEEVFWEDVWKLSIAISALLYFPHRITPEERNSVRKELTRSELPPEIVEELENAFKGAHVIHRSPSAILDIILRSPRKLVEKLRSSGLQTVWNLFNRYISSGCFIFIDSFDQALNRLFSDNLSVWCSAQCGLLKAAWELSRHNRHVKVYATIRQEAYSYFESSERANIKGNVLLLEYTKEDLHAIFAKAVQYYEGTQSIEAFIGLATVYNGYLHIHEKAFDYIYRHTIGIPRWLMVLGGEISNLRAKKYIIKKGLERDYQQKRISEIVNRVSSELALDYMKSEMRLFFHNQSPEFFIENLVTRINSSVLSQANIARISSKVVADPQWQGTSHPFCLLFNLGLLGYVARNAEGTHRRQNFKKPYEFDWNYDHILPQDPSTYYLMHPCLHHLVQNKNFRFKFNRVRIGDGVPWLEKDDKRIEAEKVKIFISYAHEDHKIVEKIADLIDDSLGMKAIIHDIWFDQWKMKAGRWFQDQMLEGLNNSDFLILIVSKRSLGSAAVGVEWKTKFSEKIAKNADSVFPFIIDDTPFEKMDGFLKNIFCYRYEGDPAKVTRLVEDMLYWKEESSETKRGRRRAT